MAKNYKELQKKMSPAARARSEAAAEKMLQELRRAQSRDKQKTAAKRKVIRQAPSKLNGRDSSLACR
jgi:hypothetical protein